MEHQISLTREELQHEWDLSSRLCERLTEAVRTLAVERDEARKQRDELLAAAIAIQEWMIRVPTDSASEQAYAKIVSAIFSVEKSVEK